jgi:hypothetical protein
MTVDTVFQDVTEGQAPKEAGLKEPELSKAGWHG